MMESVTHKIPLNFCATPPRSPSLAPAFDSHTPSKNGHEVAISMVGKVGIEPTRPCGHRFLRPTRIPVPPLAQIEKIIAEIQGNLNAPCLVTL